MKTFHFRTAFLIAATAALAAAPPVFAGTLTLTMPVSATIPTSCATFTSAPAAGLAFGNLTAPALMVALANQTATLTVNCANGTTYTIIATGGNDTAAFQHRMLNGAANYLLYNISAASAGGANFPANGAGYPGTGSSTNQTINIYGQVPVQTAPIVGTYNDTLTFTITY